MTGRFLLAWIVISCGVGLRADEPGPLSTSVDPAVIEAIKRRPTLSVTRREQPFVAHPSIYDWLLNHPDRASLAWHRLGVPCLKIQSRENGQFVWTDSLGSVMTWQVIARTEQEIVWYAMGKVKPAVLVPAVPVQAVVRLESPRRLRQDGTAEISPTVQVDFVTESSAASVLLRMLGPAVPHLIEEGTSQILFFFSGPARYLHHYPHLASELLAPPELAR